MSQNPALLASVKNTGDISLSTFTYNQNNLEIPQESGSLGSLFIGDNGTKLFVVGINNEIIIRYDLIIYITQINQS